MSTQKVFAFIEYDGMGKFRSINDAINASSYDEARKKIGEDQIDSYVAGGYPDNPIYRYNETKLEGPYNKHVVDAASEIGLHPDDVDEDEIVRHQSHRIYSECFDISKNNFENMETQDNLKNKLSNIFQDIQDIPNIGLNIKKEIIANGITNVLTDYYTVLFDNDRESLRNQELAKKFVECVVCAIPDKDHILNDLLNMVKEDFELMEKYTEKIPNNFDTEEHEILEVYGAHYDETDKQILKTLEAVVKE